MNKKMMLCLQHERQVGLKIKSKRKKDRRSQNNTMLTLEKA